MMSRNAGTRRATWSSQIQISCELFCENLYWFSTTVFSSLYTYRTGRGGGETRGEFENYISAFVSPAIILLGATRIFFSKHVTALWWGRSYEKGGAVSPSVRPRAASLCVWPPTAVSLVALWLVFTTVITDRPRSRLPNHLQGILPAAAVSSSAVWEEKGTLERRTASRGPRSRMISTRAVTAVGVRRGDAMARTHAGEYRRFPVESLGNLGVFVIYDETSTTYVLLL